MSFSTERKIIVVSGFRDKAENNLFIYLFITYCRHWVHAGWGYRCIHYNSATPLHDSKLMVSRLFHSIMVWEKKKENFKRSVRAKYKVSA